MAPSKKKAQRRGSKAQHSRTTVTPTTPVTPETPETPETPARVIVIVVTAHQAVGSKKAPASDRGDNERCCPGRAKTSH